LEFERRLRPTDSPSASPAVLTAVAGVAGVACGARRLVGGGGFAAVAAAFLGIPCVGFAGAAAPASQGFAVGVACGGGGTTVAGVAASPAVLTAVGGARRLAGGGGFAAAAAAFLGIPCVGFAGAAAPACLGIPGGAAVARTSAAALAGSRRLRCCAGRHRNWKRRITIGHRLQVRHGEIPIKKKIIGFMEFRQAKFGGFPWPESIEFLYQVAHPQSSVLAKQLSTQFGKGNVNQRHFRRFPTRLLTQQLTIC
jgi:hypothetical protein